MNNNPNSYGQMPPQQQMPQQQMPQQMPPQMPQGPKMPFSFNSDMLGAISCVCGVTGLSLGILSAAISDNTYGALGAAGSQNLSLANIKAGMSPVLPLILSIVAILISAVAVLLALKVGNDNLLAGKSRGTIPTLGLVFGCAGCIICIIALFVTGCSACSYCSIKDQVGKTTASASSLSRMF